MSRYRSWTLTRELYRRARTVCKGITDGQLEDQTFKDSGSTEARDEIGRQSTTGVRNPREC